MEAKVRVPTKHGISAKRLGRTVREGKLLPTFFVFLMAAGSLCLAQERSKPISYDLKVIIHPAQGSIQVRGTIAVPVDPSEKTLRFKLHETFEVKKLRINSHAASFSFQPGDPSPFFPATRTLLVNLSPPAPAGMVQLEIEYGGKLKEIPEFGTYDNQKLALDDQINGRMVELANYSSWYPEFGVYGHPIATTLEVSLPQGWTAICSGKKLEEQEVQGGAVSRWSSEQDTDILITAAPNYKRKVIPLATGQLEIYYTRLPADFVDAEGRDIAAIVNLFSTSLGDTTIPSGTIKHVFSPKRKGQGRAGIARPGMIVTSEGRIMDELAQDPKYSLFQDVAHEIAHFWWNFGAGQGDWINEAFAEYSSAVAVQEIQSQEQFQKILERYRNEVGELPPDAPSLAKVPFDGSGFVVRYYKGSLMLDWIRNALGSDQFYAAARDFFQMYKGKGIGTQEFRDFWKQQLGEKKELLDVWLDSPGGVPPQVVVAEVQRN